MPMRTVFVLFDSLNRLALGCYGGTLVPTPNFDRFAARSLTFDNHYVGSLPCMPARRDLHTGRLNFMHRSWGPLEPFDNSMPEILKKNGVYTHLLTDHFHYFEDGGATYHSRYSTWDFVRGQEYDTWKALVQPPVERFRKEYSDRHYNGANQANRRQHQINREFIKEEKDFPAAQCFQRAFDFLNNNRDADNWMLHLECFDPHEPFFAPERFRKNLKTNYEGPIIDWPKYAPVSENEDEVAEIRANYAALVAMCDEYFGTLLDYFDEHDLWKDTCLIVTTDHGYLLSEHDWWAKNVMPYYEEISHIPLIVHHPNLGGRMGTRTNVVTQTPDLMPTILKIFGQELPEEVQGTSVLELVERDASERSVIFGMFGGAIGVTDGTHTCFLYPPDLDDENLREYTLMPTHLHHFFSLDELKTAELSGPLPFTKGVPVLRIQALNEARRPPGLDRTHFKSFKTALYDNVADPRQLNPLHAPDIEESLKADMVAILEQHSATPEFFKWMGLDNS
jgi:arylsulfatase A-like enzyme